MDKEIYLNTCALAYLLGASFSSFGIGILNDAGFGCISFGVFAIVFSIITGICASEAK